MIDTTVPIFHKLFQNPFNFEIKEKFDLFNSVIVVNDKTKTKNKERKKEDTGRC
jgi:hypothetical protein